MRESVAIKYRAHAQSGILSWWKHRINNGRMEGINNKIKTLLRQTYGLRNERYLVLRLLSLHNSRRELPDEP